MAEGKGVEPSRLITVATAFKAVCPGPTVSSGETLPSVKCYETCQRTGGREETRTLTHEGLVSKTSAATNYATRPLENAARIELAIVCFAGRSLTDWVGVPKMCFC
jgi:hypothetical protein